MDTRKYAPLVVPQAAYEHLDTIVRCFEHDVMAACVVAEIVRGNSELTRHVPLRLISACVHRLATDGRTPAFNHID